jgi:hypothetical protein
VLVYQQTSSPLLSALTFALGFLPYLLGGTLLSSIADRFPARPALICCNLASAVLAALMAIRGMPIPALLALLVALGTVAPVFEGARAASLPDVLGGGDGYVLGALLLLAGAGSAYTLGLDQRVLDATPKPLFGRAMGVSSAGLMLTQGLGFAAAGAAAQVLSAAAVIAAAGIVGLTVVLMLARALPRPQP